MYFLQVVRDELELFPLLHLYGRHPFLFCKHVINIVFSFGFQLILKGPPYHLELQDFECYGL
jgi:hypothetical protein